MDDEAGNFVAKFGRPPPAAGSWPWTAESAARTLRAPSSSPWPAALAVLAGQMATAAAVLLWLQPPFVMRREAGGVDLTRVVALSALTAAGTAALYAAGVTPGPEWALQACELMYRAAR